MRVLTVADIRLATGMNQYEFADAIGSLQPQVSRHEARSPYRMLASGLQRYLELACGGLLVPCVLRPDGSVVYLVNGRHPDA